MKQTAANYQAQTDADAEIKARAEALEAEAREQLGNLHGVLYLKRKPLTGIVTECVTSFDVLEALYDLRDGELAQALSMLGKGRDENLLGLLSEAKATAIEQVLGRIDFNQWAACEREKQQREAA